MKKDDAAAAEYVAYRLTLHVDRWVGGIPKHPAIIKRWQEAHLKGREGEPEVDAASAETLALLGAQAMDPEEMVSGIWTGFVTDKEGNLAAEERLVKAMLKESANIVRTMPAALKAGKPIPLRARVAERVAVSPKLLTFVGADGRPVREPQSRERPVHVMTQQGPRTALKRTDYVDDVTVVCRLEVLNDGVVTERILRLILDHAKRFGIGTDRSQGNGTFVYELDRED